MDARAQIGMLNIEPRLAACYLSLAKSLKSNVHKAFISHHGRPQHGGDHIQQLKRRKRILKAKLTHNVYVDITISSNKLPHTYQRPTAKPTPTAAPGFCWREPIFKIYLVVMELID